MRKRTVLSLIGDRYLDTQHDQAYILQLETELSQRGITGIKRAVLEYVAASGLWGNVFWWEWEELNGKDVLYGWLSNLLLFSIVFAVSSYFLGVTFGVLLALVAHLITTMLGFYFRSGSVLKSEKT